MINYKFGDVQKERENEIKAKLISLGYLEEKIKEYQKLHCLACNNLRDMCQCPFSGSAHPTDEERFDWLLRSLNA